MSKEFEIRRDKYSEKREGKSILYKISCANCQTPLLIYQKDGKGDLIRCYIDRIYAFDNIVGLDQLGDDPDIGELNSIRCGNCDNLVGSYTVYKAEQRPAFNMIRGAFSRKPYKPPKKQNSPIE